MNTPRLDKHSLYLPAKYATAIKTAKAIEPDYSIYYNQKQLIGYEWLFYTKNYRSRFSRLKSIKQLFS